MVTARAAGESTATFAAENITVASEVGNVMRLAIAQQCERAMLVVSVLNQQYARYMRPWAAMVSKSRIAQKLSIWVVALDARTADAASRANVSHFDASSTRLHASVQNATAPQHTRNLPPSLGAWRFLAVWAGLAAGKRVLMSEADVLWDAKADFSAVMQSPLDYHGMMSGKPSVYNAGFFLAQGADATRFFACLLALWIRQPSDVLAAEQTFMNAHLRRHDGHQQCVPLRHATLDPVVYSCCRRWHNARRGERIDVAHLTYCRRLSGEHAGDSGLKREDACKEKVVAAFFRAPFALARLRKDQAPIVPGC